jgi:cytochrome P450
MAGFLERLEQTPSAQRWTLARRFMAEEGQAFYAELRRHRPILALPEVTVVSRHVDCIEVLRRPDAFTVALYKPKQGAYWMAQDDTAEHWREKSVMKAILDFEDLPKIRDWAATKTAAILDAHPCGIDLARDLGRAVPIALVQEWFGFEGVDPAELADWSYWNQYDAFHNHPFDGPWAHTPEEITAKREAANLRMRDYLTDLVRRRAGALQAGQPGSDPVTRLLRLSMSGALKFDVTRVVLNAGGLLIGTVETTAKAILHAVSSLLARPEALAGAVAAAAEEDPARFDGHVWEALRFDPAFIWFFRVCERPVLLAGGTDYAATIRPGTTVIALTHSAMFDPAAFPAPEKFDPGRAPQTMFHFGMGHHECLGRPIAYVLIPEIVRQILRRPNLRAAGPIDRRGTPFPESFPLAWD